MQLVEGARPCCKKEKHCCSKVEISSPHEDPVVEGLEEAEHLEPGNGTPAKQKGGKASAV